MAVVAAKITVLGSGTSTGVPVLGCNCHICRSPYSRNQRTRASILLQADGKNNLLIDCGPDMRGQLLKRGLKNLNNILFTHLHADHCHGFDDIRSLYFATQKPINCYMDGQAIKELQTRFAYMFSDTGYHGIKPEVNLHSLSLGDTECSGWEIEHIKVPHGNILTSAYRFGRFAYLTDFKYLPQKALEKWKGKIDTIIASGIRFKEHASHSSVGETIHLFEQLGVKHGILTHLSHDIDYIEHSWGLPPGVEFAYDGMEIFTEL